MENPIIMSLLVGCLVKRYGPAPIGITRPFSLPDQPLPPGQKRVKEEWENIWYIGMFGTMAFAAVMLYYKPDTRYAFACGTFGTIADPNQYTNMGTRGGQGKNGSTGRAVQIRTISFIVTIAVPP